MRRLSFIVGLITFTALACSDPTSVLPNSPSAPGVAGVEINGPASIAPGQSAQLTAMIRLADGTSKLSAPGTPLQWFTSNTQVLRVTSTGLATAGTQSGDARITVIHGSGNTQRQATREFIVLPDGTFRLVGRISEADFPSVGVIGARVTVTPGSLTTLTDLDGMYRLYGVPADVVVTVTKTGYATVSQGIQLSTHSTRNFSLALNGIRLTIGGQYTLTVDFRGSCSGGSTLSPSLQRRTYDAVITQNGPDISVALTEARFRINATGRGNKFTGRATADEVTFFLDPFDPYYYYFGPTYYPSVAERLSDSSILVPQGTVITTGSAAGLSGNMQGSIYVWDSRFPGFYTSILSYCSSSAAQFLLTPR